MPIVNRNNIICYVQNGFIEEPEKLLQIDCRFVQCEVAANEIHAKKWLTENGFYFVERWLDVSVPMRTLPVRAFRKRYETELGHENFSVLKRIYEEAFTEDRRFHLRMEYDQSLANQILKQYISDAIEQDMPLIICKYKGESIGCAFLQKTEKGYFVFLAGVRSAYQGTGAAVELYRAVADFCKEEGGSMLTGRIAASNTGVMNLYGMLNASYYNPRDLYILDRGE